MFLKKILKINSIFSISLTTSLVNACVVNTGLEMRVNLNDFVAISNLFSSEKNNFSLNYELAPKVENNEENQETEESRQLIFDQNSNFLVNNCNAFICDNSDFIGRKLLSTEYNNLINLPDNNYFPNLESSQFAIDNLAKRLDIEPFLESREIIYDFSEFSLTQKNSTSQFYFNRLIETNELFFISKQNLEIQDSSNSSIILEEFTLFDLTRSLTSEFLEDILKFEPNFIKDETTEEINLKFYVNESEISNFISEISKLFFYANDSTNLTFEKSENEENSNNNELLSLNKNEKTPLGLSKIITSYMARLNQDIEISGSEFSRIIIEQINENDKEDDSNEEIINITI